MPNLPVSMSADKPEKPYLGFPLFLHAPPSPGNEARRQGWSAGGSRQGDDDIGLSAAARERGDRSPVGEMAERRLPLPTSHSFQLGYCTGNSLSTQLIETRNDRSSQSTGLSARGRRRTAKSGPG
jgi:hypothetical protein